MSIVTLSSINEQLLKSIGVGVAIMRFADLEFHYYNAAFAQWFGDPATSDTVRETIDGSGSTRLELGGQIAEDALRVTGTWWDGEPLDIVAEDGEERTSADVLDYLGRLG